MNSTNFKRCANCVSCEKKLKPKMNAMPTADIYGMSGYMICEPCFWEDGYYECDGCDCAFPRDWSKDEDCDTVFCPKCKEADTKKANDITLAFFAENCPKMLPALLASFDPTLTEKQRNRITRIRAERAENKLMCAEDKQ